MNTKCQISKAGAFTFDSFRLRGGWANCQLQMSMLSCPMCWWRKRVWATPSCRNVAQRWDVLYSLVFWPKSNPQTLWSSFVLGTNLLINDQSYHRYMIANNKSRVVKTYLHYYSRVQCLYDWHMILFKNRPIPAGFEQQISGIVSDRSANWATATTLANDSFKLTVLTKLSKPRVSLVPYLPSHEPLKCEKSNIPIKVANSFLLCLTVCVVCRLE